MCGRYTLTYEEVTELEEFLYSAETDHLLKNHGETSFANYNVAPSHHMPVACSDGDGRRMLTSMHWGFMGWKPKPGTKPFLPINTRDDSVTEKPMWKRAFTSNRCIVPASGFYEWAGKKGNKTPHYIYPIRDKFLGFAGIYSDMTPDDAEVQMSFSIITTSPNSVMKNIHDRMPVILHPSEFDDWLNPNNRDPDYLTDFLHPCPDDVISEHIVSKAVGNVRNNHEGLIQKAGLF